MLTDTTTTHIGMECLRNVILEPQPAYCHEWEGPSAKDKHDFSEAVQAANNALLKAGVNPVHGISKETENRIVDNLPEELNRLRAYAIVNGEMMIEEEFKTQLHEYIKCVNGRASKIREMLGPGKDWNPKNALAVGLALSKSNVGVWGSRRQYAYGQTISRLLSAYQVTKIELHPVLAVMLCPAGGMAGWGNWILYVGDLHDCINVHAVVHDAFGYLLAYHGKGPGYNYLRTCAVFRTTYPMCCQPQGCWQARKIMKKCGLYGHEGRLKRARFIMKAIHRMKTMNRTTIPGPDMRTIGSAETFLRKHNASQDDRN